MWEYELEIQQFVLVFVMTLLGAIANYAYKVLSGQQFYWQMLLLHAFVSVFAGALVLMAAMHYSWEPEVAGGVSGLAGWSGAGFIKSLEKKLFRKMEETNDHQ